MNFKLSHGVYYLTRKGFSKIGGNLKFWRIPMQILPIGTISDLLTAWYNEILERTNSTIWIGERCQSISQLKAISNQIRGLQGLQPLMDRFLNHELLWLC